MTALGNLSIVTLGVADVERSARFYAALGWRRSTSSVEGAIHWFDVGGCYLGVYAEPALSVDSGLTADDVRPPGWFRGVTLAINLASTAEVDAALETAVAAGATCTLDPVMTEYGVYHACFTDPDGHVWEVAWNPDFPFVDGRTVIP